MIQDIAFKDFQLIDIDRLILVNQVSARACAIPLMTYH